VARSTPLKPARRSRAGSPDLKHSADSAMLSRRHFFDHDAPTLEDILEGWKLMDAERKRVFAIPLY
jgi:hypothetical protein